MDDYGENGWDEDLVCLNFLFGVISRKSDRTFVLADTDGTKC